MIFCEKIKCEIEGKIAVVTFDNPPVNSLTEPVLKGLDECVTYLSQCDDIRAVIFTGEGKSFIAGADIKEFSEWPVEELISRTRYGQAVTSRLEQLPIPTIAAINGFALGGGLETALCCDIRIASEKARVGLPEATLGIIPAYGGTSRLPALIGEGNAKKVIFMAQPIKAEEALKLGIVQEVVAPEELLPRAKEIAQRIASVAPEALRQAKSVIHKRRDCTLAQSLENEVQSSTECFFTEDRREGIDAFINKREANFSNK